MYKLNQFVLLITLVSLVGCTPPSSLTTPTPTVPPTSIVPSSTPVLPTPSPAPTATATEVPIPEIHPLDNDSLKSRIDHLASSFLLANKASALSVAVVMRNPQTGQLEALLLNYGSTAKGGGQPVTSNTIYEIGSITKVFTGIMLAEDVNNGSMKLEDPIQNYFPLNVHAPVYKDIPIKVVDLATHRSALPRDLTSDDIEDLYVWLNGYELSHKPGSQYVYSNLGYSLLGDMIARLADGKYDDLEFQLVSKPLGLADTVVTLSEEQKSRLAQGYTYDGSPAPYFPDTGAMAPAGYLRSTITDMTRFLIENMNPDATALTPSIKLAQTMQTEGRNPGTGIGLGWEIFQPETNDERIWKSGATSSFSSYISFQTGTPIGFVALTNGMFINNFADDMLRLLSQYAK